LVRVREVVVGSSNVSMLPFIAVTEWLTGNPNLSGDPVHVWLYLFFFNALWVW
jgi:hypothetical protein